MQVNVKDNYVRERKGIGETLEGNLMIEALYQDGSTQLNGLSESFLG